MWAIAKGISPPLEHHRDGKYCPAFQQLIDAAGVTRAPLPPRSPNLNAYAERWARSVKEECLSQLLLFGEASLRHALTPYGAHFYHERNHNSKSCRPETSAIRTVPSGSDKPTVYPDIISLVASSCGHYRGQIEPCAAHEFAVPVATPRGLAKRLQHHHPPRAQPAAPIREQHCRRPRLTPEVWHRSGTLSRSGTTWWCTREEKRPNRLTIPRDAMPASLSSFSPPGRGLATTGSSSKAIDITEY